MNNIQTDEIPKVGTLYYSYEHKDDQGLHDHAYLVEEVAEGEEESIEIILKPLSNSNQ
jgi:hypothetical protein